MASTPRSAPLGHPQVCGGNRSRYGADAQQILASVSAPDQQLDPHAVLVSLLRARTPTVPVKLRTARGRLNPQIMTSGLTNPMRFRAIYDQRRNVVKLILLFPLLDLPDGDPTNSWLAFPMKSQRLSVSKPTDPFVPLFQNAVLISLGVIRLKSCATVKLAAARNRNKEGIP